MEEKEASPEDIEKFKKNALLQKSMDEIKRRADEMHEIRGSPKRYRQVKSKVARNLKVATKNASISRTQALNASQSEKRPDTAFGSTGRG